MLIPSSLNWLTWDSVNQVSQCSANFSSTVLGYALANALGTHEIRIASCCGVGSTYDSVAMQSAQFEHDCPPMFSHSEDHRDEGVS